MKIVEVNDYCMKRKSNGPDGKMYFLSELEEYGINFPIQFYIPDDISSSPDIVFANRTPRTMNDLTFEEVLVNGE